MIVWYVFVFGCGFVFGVTSAILWAAVAAIYRDRPVQLRLERLDDDR